MPKMRKDKKKPGAVPVKQGNFIENESNFTTR